MVKKKSTNEQREKERLMNIIKELNNMNNKMNKEEIYKEKNIYKDDKEHKKSNGYEQNKQISNINSKNKSKKRNDAKICNPECINNKGDINNAKIEKQERKININISSIILILGILLIGASEFILLDKINKQIKEVEILIQKGKCLNETIENGVYKICTPLCDVPTIIENEKYFISNNSIQILNKS